MCRHSRHNGDEIHNSPPDCCASPAPPLFPRSGNANESPTSHHVGALSARLRKGLPLSDSPSFMEKRRKTAQEKGVNGDGLKPLKKCPTSPVLETVLTFIRRFVKLKRRKSDAFRVAEQSLAEGSGFGMSGKELPWLPDFKIAFTFTGEYRETVVRPACEELLKYG